VGMKFLFFLIFILSSNAHATKAADKFLGSCQYYRSLASEMRCPQNPYLIQFGEHYCRKFDRYRVEFTPAGRKIIRRIKRCLQTSLEKVSGLTCSNVKTVAIASHSECYRRAEFCKMSFEDKLRLEWIVKAAIFDFEYRQEMFKILSSCD
jgi:hypothetical protein